MLKKANYNPKRPMMAVEAPIAIPSETQQESRIPPIPEMK